MLLLIAAAYALPRAVALRGVEFSAQVVFGDMPLHLLNLEKELKTWTHGYSVKNTPYFGVREQELTRHNEMRWPPGVYKVALPLARTFGTLSIWTTLLTNLLFQGVLVLGLILLGRRLGGLHLGLWAALLAVLCPPLAGASFYLTLDFPLTAMVLLCLALLLETEGFRHTRLTLIFGLAAALGLYVKLSFPLYLLCPSLVVLGAGLRRGPGRARVLINLALAVGLLIAVSSLLGNFEIKEYLQELSYHADPTVEDEALPESVLSMGSLEWLLAVGRMMITGYTLPLILLALPGLGLLLVRRRLPARWFLISYLGGGYLLFTLINAKLERYSQPLYPLLCLLTAWWIIHWVPRRWRWVALLWTAGAFTATLYLCYEKPLPWNHDEPGGPLVLQSWHYDNRPPTRKELDGLRRYKVHPYCDLKPVLESMLTMAGKMKPRKVMSITFPQTPKDFISNERNITYDTLASVATQFFPDRIVVNAPLNAPAMPAPYTFYLHKPGINAGKINANTRLLAQKQVVLDCGAPAPMLLSLLEFSGKY